MGVYEKNLVLINVHQQLIELMADYLDDDMLVIEQNFAGLKDPIERENSELHIRMAQAAYEEYKNTMLSHTGGQVL